MLSALQSWGHITVREAVRPRTVPACVSFHGRRLMRMLEGRGAPVPRREGWRHVRERKNGAAHHARASQLGGEDIAHLCASWHALYLGLRDGSIGSPSPASDDSELPGRCTSSSSSSCSTVAADESAKSSRGSSASPDGDSSPATSGVWEAISPETRHLHAVGCWSDPASYRKLEYADLATVPTLDAGARTRMLLALLSGCDMEEHSAEEMQQRQSEAPLEEGSDLAFLVSNEL